MAELHALVYVSTATNLLSLEQVEHLLQRAKTRNLELGITGVLLYDTGNFMQYIEGALDGLIAVYQRIQHCNLHYGLVELLRWQIAQREFPQWSMGFRSVTAVGMTVPTDDSELLLNWLTKPPDPGSAASVLLSNFWNRNRGPQSF
jgi:Sensors of blue-light using FAD